MTLLRLLTIGGLSLVVNKWFVALLVLFSLVGLAGKAMLVFGMVLLHELAHSAAARAAGLAVREIELLPFGGVARIDGLSTASPQVELAVAAAGPALSLALAALTGVVAAVVPAQAGVLRFAAQVNAMLGCFNLLPGLPLDGGRMVRAALSLTLGYVRATKVAVWLGRLCAVVLALLLLWQYAVDRSFNITVAAAAMFIFCAASAEKQQAALWGMQHLVRKKEVFLARGIMPVRQMAVLDSTRAQEVIRLFVPQKFHLVMVVDKKCVVQGVLTETEIWERVMVHGLQAPLRRFL